MNKEIDKPYIIDFLERNTLAVVSTVDENGHPHAAPIFYVMDDALNFFFVTPSKTQKSTNLDHQKELVLTITDEINRETIQVRGVANKDEDLLQEVLNKLNKKLNRDLEFVTTLPLLRYENQSKTVVVIKPIEIRFRKYHEDRLEEKILETTP